MNTSKILIALLCVAFCVPTNFAAAENANMESDFEHVESMDMVSFQDDYSSVSTEASSLVIGPQADPNVISYTIYAASNGQVEFSLTLKNRASSISITSVTLSTNGGSAVSLSKPSTTASNTNYYEAFKTYTFTAGNTYTLTCTWNIDGYKYTRSTTFTK